MPVDAAQVEQVFNEAVLKLPHERAALLARACGDDAELRERVGALLAAHDRSDPLRMSFTTSDTEARGMRIGRYKLLEQIGEGGFGVVFMAEQASPVHRRVALKIIKL